MRDLTVDPKWVIKLLNNLANGPDGLSVRVLKECCFEIAPILASIYNGTLAQGAVHSDWQQANITAVFKKSEKYGAANCRPGLLTSICCKTPER